MLVVWLIMWIIWLSQEGGKLKFEQNKSNKICYFIDNFNLPVNAKLRLEKDQGPPSGLQVEHRLRPIHSYGTEVFIPQGLFFSFFCSFKTLSSEYLKKKFTPSEETLSTKCLAQNI